MKVKNAKFLNRIKDEDVVLTEELIEERNSDVTDVVVAQPVDKLDKEPKKGRKKAKPDDEVDFFPDLAKLMNVSIKELKEEFFFFQVKKLMSKLGKVIVRYNKNPKQLEKVIYNCATLGVGEVLLSPVYLPNCANAVEKNELHDLPVCSLIDFPFGESSISNKITEVKRSVKMGVDGVNVVVPSLFIKPDYVKTFKKHAKKIGKCYPNNAGIALNATDLSEDELKTAVKLTEKTKLTNITLLFGETPIKDLIKKTAFIKNAKAGKTIKVLANVSTADDMMQVFALGADVILTPYADAIGEELVKRFKIKGVKLR